MDIRDIYKRYVALENSKAPTKPLKEASMNISMNGQTAAEVAELVGILKNAGMPDAGPVADMHVDMPMAHDAMHTDIDSHNSPCGEEVEEATDNEQKYMEILKNLLSKPVKSSAEFRDYMDAEFEKDRGFMKWLGSGPGARTPQGKYAIDLYYSNNEEVEEDEWDNSPDENYKDDNFMVHDMGNDMHRKKDRRAIRTVDPALESTLKTDLKANWQNYKNK